MARYASGKHAIFWCPRCGMKIPYTGIRLEADTNIRVCSGCWDEPDPYRRLLGKPLVDAVALRFPSPDPIDGVPMPAPKGGGICPDDDVNGEDLL